jgi:hypothetical protein
MTNIRLPIIAFVFQRQIGRRHRSPLDCLDRASTGSPRSTQRGIAIRPMRSAANFASSASPKSRRIQRPGSPTELQSP